MSPRLLGPLLLLAATMVFATSDVIGKHLVATWPAAVVVGVRYLVNLVLMAAAVLPSQGRRAVETRRTGWVVARGFSLVAASWLFSLALARMPVAETAAIVFVSPLVVMLAAGPLLGERIGVGRWLAATVGFAGALLIVRPGGGLDPWGVAAALGAMVTTVAYVLLSRRLAATERTVPMLFLTVAAGALTFGVALPWTWTGPRPGAVDTGLFLALGALAGVGHYLFTAAFRHADASVLAPLNYAQLAFVTLLGWVVFAEAPSGWSLVGIALVMAAGVGGALAGSGFPVWRARP